MNEVRSPEILEEVETLSSEPETSGKKAYNEAAYSGRFDLFRWTF